MRIRTWPVLCPSYHLTHSLLSCTPGLRGSRRVIRCSLYCQELTSSGDTRLQGDEDIPWPGNPSGVSSSSSRSQVRLSLWYNQDACVSLVCLVYQTSKLTNSQHWGWPSQAKVFYNSNIHPTFLRIFGHSSGSDCLCFVVNTKNKVSFRLLLLIKYRLSGLIL